METNVLISCMVTVKSQNPRYSPGIGGGGGAWLQITSALTDLLGFVCNISI